MRYWTKVSSYALKTRLFVWLAVVGIIISPAGKSLALSVGVIYPDVRQPYQQIFENILTGLDRGFGEAGKRYRLQAEFDSSELQRWVRNEGIDTVVALGNRGLRSAAMLPAEVDIVVGAVQAIPDAAAFPGITLTPDPEAVFAQLKLLAPKVRSVTVIYNPERSGWLIARALRAAGAHGLKLHALAANNLKEAALLYRGLLADAGDRSNAIWLLQDPTTLDERAILPTILEEAWAKHLLVFSSNPTHVRRGALFSFYPDNVAMGYSLGVMAKRLKQQDEPPRIVPLQDLSIAVNQRTADHLGLKFTAKQRRNFDLVFPSR